MNEIQFVDWLCEKYSNRTVKSRVTNCHTIEQYEGDLDGHFANDHGDSLINKLTYSKDDERNKRKAKHKIPINGNIYNGTATYKQAAKLYLEFKSGNKSKKLVKIKKTAENETKDWPTWKYPKNEELYEIIKLSAKYIKFLHPDIIREIVNDNKKHQDKWSVFLKNRNIRPEIYLWEKSPCAFPGIRRYAGSKEIAYFRNHTDISADQIEGAVKLDDNDFPKQIWSFIFRGNKFQKFGPKNYALAHLADHKEYKNRLFSEFNIESNNQQHKLYGLFTCPTNTVYIPNALLRPTDFSPEIRKLLIGKAYDLYGNFCNILPPWMKVDHVKNDGWHHSDFKWSDPVGTTENIKSFLDFRLETIKSIFAA